MMVYALGAYEGPLKALILRKNRFDTLASAQLGKLLAGNGIISSLPVDFFIPVPLHWTRYAWRGYNQAEVIAQELAKRSAGRVVNPVTRAKRTSFQSAVSGKQRFENVKNVFEIDHDEALLLKNKHVVIVDDLMTTGATIQALAKKLVRYNPASITAIVAARVV